MVAPSRTNTIGRPVRKTRVRISKSGQITLPAKIRKQLDVRAGDFITFSEEPNGDIRIQADSRLSLEEIMAQAVKWPEGESREQVFADARRHGMVRERYRHDET